jgi:hypothetical protein
MEWVHETRPAASWARCGTVVLWKLKRRSCLGVWGECERVRECSRPHLIEAHAAAAQLAVQGRQRQRQRQRPSRTVWWPSGAGGVLVINGSPRSAEHSWSGDSRQLLLECCTVLLYCSVALLLPGHSNRLWTIIHAVSSILTHSLPQTARGPGYRYAICVLWQRVIDGAGPTQPPTYCSWNSASWAPISPSGSPDPLSIP